MSVQKLKAAFPIILINTGKFWKASNLFKRGSSIVPPLSYFHKTNIYFLSSEWTVENCTWNRQVHVRARAHTWCLLVGWENRAETKFTRDCHEYHQPSTTTSTTTAPTTTPPNTTNTINWSANTTTTTTTNHYHFNCYYHYY